MNSKLSPPMNKLMNLTFSTFKLPEKSKIAKLLFFKYGNRNIEKNYRPISILTVPSKIIQKAVQCILLDYVK